MQRPPVKPAFVLVTMLLASSYLCFAQQAAVSGVVRDSAGTAQLGVLVQVVATDSTIAGHAFTDLRGHYLINNLRSGHYGLHATAALFLPAMRQNLELPSGARTVVNLTLSTIFDATSWLPTERRKADESGDDWKWTLRSAANRPILRVLEDGQLIMASSSATDSHAPSMRGHAIVTSGDGGFGNGGTHSILTTDSTQADGMGIVMRIDAKAGRASDGVGPSSEMSVGFERQTGFATTTRAVASFQSHPELVSAGAVAGLQNMELATAQRTRLGDLVTVEAGGALYATHTEGYEFATQPFLRVMMEPGAGWGFGYRMASSRDLQGFSGLNAIQPDLPVAVMTSKGLRTERGRHHEISVSRKIGRGQAQIAVYQDALERVPLAGMGTLTQADLQSCQSLAASGDRGGISDPSTNSFRIMTSGYRARGVNLMLSQPLGQNMWTVVEYSSGDGLAAPSSADPAAPPTLPSMLEGLQRRAARSASVALKGTFPATGTKLRAVYRWQPESLLTPVDAYREFSDQAFLGFHLRQPIRWDGLLPPGLEASIEVTNLLAQGYQPFLSSDGHVLYLAQSPKTLQAGLSISF